MKYFKKRFGIFIDEQRKARKIVKTDFIEGICSVRQYKRYLSGEFYIPNEKLILFAERLKVDVVDLFQKYNNIHNEEHTMMMDTLKLLNQYKYKEILKTLNDMKTDKLLSELSIEQVELVKIVSRYMLSIITKEEAKSQLIKLIDYESCIKKNTLNIVELNAISHIAMIDSKQGIRTSTLELYNKVIDLSNDTHLENNTVAPIYANTSQLLGLSGEYEKALEISLLGIEYCLEHRTYKSLSNLYYYAALAELLIGNKDDAISLAKKSFYALSLENNENKFNYFKNDFEKEFKMDISEIIIL